MIQKNWQELIKPTNLEVTPLEGEHKAKIVVEPLERGFGLTLGNAIRRVLLFLIARRVLLPVSKLTESCTNFQSFRVSEKTLPTSFSTLRDWLLPYTVKVRK